jgi:hypothetical protein
MLTAGQAMGAFSQGNDPESIARRQAEQKSQLRTQEEAAKLRMAQQAAVPSNNAVMQAFQIGADPATQAPEQALAALSAANPTVDARAIQEAFQRGLERRPGGAEQADPVALALADGLEANGNAAMAEAIRKRGNLKGINDANLTSLFNQGGLGDPGKVNSEVGRRVLDMGYKANTPEFNAKVAELSNVEKTVASSQVLTQTDRFIRNRVDVKGVNAKINNAVNALQGRGLAGADALQENTLIDLYGGTASKAQAGITRFIQSDSLVDRLSNIVNKTIRGEVTQSTAEDRAHLLYAALKAQEAEVTEAATAASALTGLSDSQTKQIKDLYGLPSTAQDFIGAYEKKYLKGKPMSPSPGAVMDGYRFKGGDPAVASNWEKV